MGIQFRTNYYRSLLWYKSPLSRAFKCATRTHHNTQDVFWDRSSLHDFWYDKSIEKRRFNNQGIGYGLWNGRFGNSSMKKMGSKHLALP